MRTSGLNMKFGLLGLLAQIWGCYSYLDGLELVRLLELVGPQGARKPMKYVAKAPVQIVAKFMRIEDEGIRQIVAGFRS